MEYRRFNEYCVLRVDRGEEVMESLMKVAEAEHVTLGKIEGLGAADYVKAGLYDVETRSFISRDFNEPLEITSLIGSITESGGKPYLHVHITVADAEQKAYGGHLKEARIGGTAEIIITVMDGYTGRQDDVFGNTGLQVLRF